MDTDDIILGTQAGDKLDANTSNNIMLGNKSGFDVTSGDNNVMIGQSAGENTNADVDETGTIQPKEEVPVSMNTVNPASDRFASAGVIPNPIGMRGTGTVDRNKAATLFPDDKIFTPDTFAAQGGIMNARKPIQRVA